MLVVSKLKVVKWSRVIALWQIVGGGFAFLSLLQSVPAFRAADTPVVLEMLLFAFCATTAAAGLGLYKHKPWGRRLSLLVQGMQIVGIRIPLLGWYAVLGPFLTLWWNGSDAWGINAGAKVELWLAFTDQPALISLNLVAAAFFLLLVDEPHATSGDAASGAGASVPEKFGEAR